ncbi:MAG: NAD(+) synthase [Bacteroidetes bacterium]|nr:NAD(+) synthase [Bacteroidota bacterium]MBS1539274.1 NAD(+) synthase [Bacteroidota bacterium]
MADRIIKIAGASLNQTPLDWENNIANILQAMEEAKKENVKILCLPELCITGYGCEDVFLSDWLAEKAFQKLLTIAQHSTAITVYVGLPVRLDGQTYNGAALIDNGKILGITLKQNLPHDGVHYEPRWFVPWQAGKKKEIILQGHKIWVGDLIYSAQGIKIGIEICEDGWSKEKRPGYKLKEQGVDLILNGSASHFAFGKSKERESQVVVAGSSLFHCTYVFVNLLGNEAGRMVYDGDIIMAQQGKLVASGTRLSFKNYNLLTAEINFDNPGATPTLPQADVCQKNEEFGQAAALALFDYLRKSRAKGFVLSLSGGADSSCCAVLVAEMVRRASHELGWEAFSKKLELATVANEKEAVGLLLTCAYQGTKNSSLATLQAAQTLAGSIGANFFHWTVDEEINSYESKIEKALQRKLTWQQDDIAKQNIQARARSPIIWMLANVKQSILLTTSNRSEGDVGYATMDGDTSGSLAPLAGVDKPFILQWLQWAEKELAYSGLKPVNTLQPTAELRPPDRAQTDEKDLMPYPVLVEIEKLGIRDRKKPSEIYAALSEKYQDTADLKNYIKKFFRLWSINQWKRERFAPSFHFDELNVDPRSWCRFPILSGGFKDELEELDKL